MIAQLMKRDLSVYKKRIIGVSLGALLIGMLMVFVNTNLDRMFSGAGSFIILSVIVPFLPELKNKSVWVHTASLPVSRRAMVLARFFVSLLITGLNLVLWVVSYVVLMDLFQSDAQYALRPNIVLNVAMSVLFSLSLFYFAYFRFNFIGAMVFYLISVLMPQLVQTLLYKTTNFEFENFNQPLLMTTIYIGLFVIALLSSLHIFPKRDL